MDLKKYQELAKRTFPDLGEKINLAHMVMGIYSEYYEFIEAVEKEDPVNIGEELADMCWYLANYCNIRNLKFDKLFVYQIKTDDFVISNSKLQDIVKKNIAYNKPIDEVVELSILLNIGQWLKNSCSYYEIDIAEYLEKNINKLKARYPDKFTEENAINRNLEVERSILEK